MKFKINKRYRLLLTLICGIITFVGCSDDDNETNNRTETLSDVITVPFFIQNDTGNTPTNPNELIYEIRENEPIVDTDGNHMSFGEFSTVEGSITVTCLRNGVDIDVTLSGLVPHGVYTLWHVTFNEGGIDPTQDMLNIRGIGAIGAGDGLDNFFIASPNGTANISAFSPTPSNLSMIGDIKDCPLYNEEEWHIVGSYHLDGKTYGPDLGPDGTVVEQFAFVFTN
ncbi:hypothetical protein [Winogradskyella sp.]|uniref:hypothetical protein n=1 Tax=Winogradskyella sp. TaxID=1883156 RepID=UPI003BA8B81F